MVEVEGEKDVAARNVQAAPAVASGRAAGGQGCSSRDNGYGPRLVRCVRHVVPSQVVADSVSEWPEEAGVGGGRRRGRGYGPRAVVGFEVEQRVGKRVRRCAAPRQTHWSELQGRAACGSQWHTQGGHAVAGGWR